MSRVFPALLTIVALTVLPLVGVTAQSDPAVVLRLDGQELLDCDPADLVFDCFKVTEGDPATAFVAGATVRVALTAEGNAPHGIAVTDAEEKDANGIMTDGAIAQSAEAEAGETVTLEFTVPDVGTLYFWCPVGLHELSGMHFEADVQPAANVTNETEDEEIDDGEEDTGDGNETADDNATVPPVDTAEPSAPASGNETDDETDDNGTTLPEEQEDAPLHLALPFVALGLVGLVVVQRRRSA